MDTSNRQIVALRRRMLYNLDPVIYPGLQLILSKPIQTLFNQETNPFITSNKEFPRLPFATFYSSNEENIEDFYWQEFEQISNEFHD